MSDIDEAVRTFFGKAKAIHDEIYNRAIDDAAHAVACTPKHPASDHDAHQRAIDAIRKLKV